MMLWKNSSVSVRNDWRSSLSQFGKSPGVGWWLFRFRSISHWLPAMSPNAPPPPPRAPRPPPVAQHPLDLLLEHGRLIQFPGCRERQQLVVRDAAPQEERESRSELQVSDFRGAAGR